MSEPRKEAFFNIGDVVIANNGEASFIGKYAGRCPATGDLRLTHAFCWMQGLVSKTELRFALASIHASYGEMNATGGDDFQFHARSVKKANPNEGNIYITGDALIVKRGSDLTIVQ